MKIKQMKQLEQIREECRAMVRKRAAASGTVALIPIPGADMALDIGLMVKLFPAINRKFGLTREQIDTLDTESKAILGKIILKAGNKLVGRIITREVVQTEAKKAIVRLAANQTTKTIPFIGPVLSAALAFTTMTFLGYRHIDSCCAIVTDMLETAECP